MGFPLLYLADPLADVQLFDIVCCRLRIHNLMVTKLFQGEGAGRVRVGDCLLVAEEVEKKSSNGA